MKWEGGQGQIMQELYFRIRNLILSVSFMGHHGEFRIGEKGDLISFLQRTFLLLSRDQTGMGQQWYREMTLKTTLIVHVKGEAGSDQDGMMGSVRDLGLRVHFTDTDDRICCDGLHVQQKNREWFLSSQCEEMCIRITRQV